MIGPSSPHDELRTERLVLRRWRPEDLEPAAAMNADPEVMAGYDSVLDRVQSDAFVRRVDGYFALRGYGLWAVELHEEATFIGFAGLSKVRVPLAGVGDDEIAWRFAREHWGKGYAGEACQAVLRHAFDVLGLAEVVTYTAADNAAGRKAAERLGMTTDPTRDFVPEASTTGRTRVVYSITEAQFRAATT